MTVMLCMPVLANALNVGLPRYPVAPTKAMFLNGSAMSSERPLDGAKRGGTIGRNEIVAQKTEILWPPSRYISLNEACWCCARGDCKFPGSDHVHEVTSSSLHPINCFNADVRLQNPATSHSAKAKSH